MNQTMSASCSIDPDSRRSESIGRLSSRCSTAQVRQIVVDTRFLSERVDRDGWQKLRILASQPQDVGVRDVSGIKAVHRLALGKVLQDIGDDKQALEVYRRALAVYPRMERIPDLVKTLQEKIEGRDI